MDGTPAFACGCLNIKIYPKPTNDNSEKSTSREPQATNEFVEVYVGEGGIIVLYSELTLRTRSAASVDSEGQKYQTVSVKCLACDLYVYRIRTNVSSDVDAKEGPLLPSEDWAEHDILRSRTGWIEVYNANGDNRVQDASQSKLTPNTSRYFEVRLPENSGSGSLSSPNYLPKTRISIPKDYHFLPTLPEFLPQPPFTPSHPSFRRLATVANSKSTEMRQELMERCAAFAKEQVTLLQDEENKIKIELELLWNKVDEGLRKAEDERDGQTLGPLLRRRSDSPVRLGGISSSLPALSTMRGFTPSTYHGTRVTTRTASSTHISGQSGLSSSVAVTGFYHPRSRYEDNAQRTSPIANGRQLHSSVTSTSDDISITPSTLSSGSTPSDESVDLPDTLRRNMNERTDISASLQVFNSVLEQEASKRQARAEVQKSKGKGKEVVKEEDPGRSLKKPSSVSKSSGKDSEADSQTGSAKSSEPGRERRRSGSKRVTFDVEPDVVTIKREVSAEVDDDPVTSGADDLIFELEEDDEEASKQVNGVKPSTGINGRNRPKISSEEFSVKANDHPTSSSSRASERSNHRPSILPESLAALRPASLPAPSHIRPHIRPRSNIASSSRHHDESIASRNLRGKQGTNTFSHMVPRGGYYDEELRRLVGADMPSHRGSWSDNYDTWQRFQQGRRGSDSPIILEEDESTPNLETKANSWSDFNMAGIARSLPVPMAPLSQIQQQKQPAKLESTVIEEPEEESTQASATAIRQKAYAERDVKREFDPGYMDFLGGEFGEDEIDMTLPSEAEGHVSQSRSREQAFQILEARNKLPPDGMWRSLAS
ncbi:hypothetical protein SCHPADRAFT_900052 [Schizopora paradoxa]|uniref:Uncharacterized protein n=1 Tax=Schizopora paradoxa TaxID=27342 RepID=A0A0H2S151_9AGAM|nr:hypothetical protein SCHPADRAFT_900052 [Schizopora paradoxa]